MRAIKLLLKRGAQTDLVDRTGYSALRWAVIHERIDMVKLCCATTLPSPRYVGQLLAVAHVFN